VDVPPVGQEVTVELEHVDRLKGLDQPLPNQVIVSRARQPAPGSIFTFTVAPPTFFVELIMTGEDRILALPGSPGQGDAEIVLFSLGDNFPGGVSGFQYSLVHTDEIHVTDVRIAPEMLDTLPGLDAIEFASFAFGPTAVDPDELFLGDDPECEIPDGTPHGNSLVADVHFGVAEEPGHNLPATTTIQTLSIDFEQARPFESVDDPPQIGGFEWRDCQRALGGEPVKTRIQVRGKSQAVSRRDPHLVAFDAIGGNQVPGDLNQDGATDLTDALALLAALFLGDPAEFPCGDGTIEHEANKTLLDGQPDGNVDLSDAIVGLRFLFLGGPAHWLAVPGEEAAACVAIPGCGLIFGCE
jgi:hypothetical protein